MLKLKYVQRGTSMIFWNNLDILRHWISIQWKVISASNIDIHPTKQPSANFINFEAINKFEHNIKTIQGKLPWLSQQSTLAGNSEPIQFEIPQTKSPIQSSLVSQSP